MNTDTDEIYKLIKRSIIDDIAETISEGYELDNDQLDLMLLYNITEETIRGQYE